MNNKFYILANKYKRKLGYFLLELESDLEHKSEPRYVIKWENKLEIDDAALQIFDKGTEKDKDKWIVVSYKSIHVNTYTVFVVDIESSRIQFRHDNYQLWESPVLGFLNNYQNDFIILNKEGTSFLPLGTVEKRAIYNPDGTERMVHSLTSCDYLKISESNLLTFERPKQDSNNRKVKIQEQQTDTEANTYYDDIYQVNIDEMTLRELMVVYSIFTCDSAIDIVDLIELQPNPKLFQKSFMELDQSNMIQIMAFDSRIIKTLLEFDCEEEDDETADSPIFYKMRHVLEDGTYYVSALNVALENNQIRALNLIINYIVEHQNNYAFFFLFDDIFLELMKQGISVTRLLESDILTHEFDVEEYPAIHQDNSYLIKPYNGSIFQLKGTYSQVFTNFANSGGEDEDKEKKFYKIKYTLNLLPSVTYQNGESILMNELMDILGNTEELEIFRTKAVEDFFTYQWENYAKHLHYFGGFVHFVYVILFFIYCDQVFNERNYDNRVILCWLMLVCLIYPMVYDFLQLKKTGLGEYLADPWNYLDQGHIWFGIANVFIQRTSSNILSKES